MKKLPVPGQLSGYFDKWPSKHSELIKPIGYSESSSLMSKFVVCE